MSDIAAPATTPDRTADARRTQEAVDLAAALLREARTVEQHEPRSERRRRARLSTLVRDPHVAQFTMALTDEVMRIESPARAAKRLGELVDGADLSGLGLIDRLALRVGSRVAKVAPRLVMPFVQRRVRHETEGVILQAEDPAFARHIATRTSEGARVNINVLGEAILGRAEADRRLDAVLERIARPDVDYVSVKISAISPSVSALAFDATVADVAVPLRRLYRAAGTHTFVNLDMEEYRDLALTMATFTTVLDEPEFVDTPAGIVLQAYLPDSHAAATELAEWALGRRSRGGAPIKIRVVKGANLAMEHVEAELHGWASAPFGSKSEVDASYKAMLDLLLQPRYDDVLRVGLASHNLFDVAWGLGLRRQLDERGQASRLEMEMLEGMAPAQAAAVRERAGGILLYGPVARRDDFAAAVAYLVRRLDENTAPANFLAHLLDLEPGDPAFFREAAKFTTAVSERHEVATAPRRTQDRQVPAPWTSLDTPFWNEPDTDFVLPANRRWLADHLAAPAADLSLPLADLPEVEHAVTTAVDARARWATTSAAERARLINRVGDVMNRRRGELIAAMVREGAKTVPEADPEASEAVDMARYYAREALRLEDRSVPSEPVGTVVVTPPWNFPVAIPAGGVLSSLAAGNTVILKPAPETVALGHLVAQLCWEAGISRDVLQVMRCPDNEVGRRLITHPDVSAVILTGALDTARMFLGWRPDLRLHAETSGKNAMVITAAADVDLAVRDLVRSAFGHAGQKCSAVSLAIVEAPLYDSPRFLERIRDAVTTLRVGAAEDLASDVGPLIGPPSGPLLRALTTLEPGESWLVTPERHSEDGSVWSPGVKLGVASGSWFHMTECFGPVLGIMRATDLDDALRLQNAVDLGLTAGLHSLDPEEIRTWTDRVQAGNLYVNRTTTGAIVRRQPFGGWKRSVVGPTVKAGGPNYVARLRRWTDDPTVSITNATQAFDTWMDEHGRGEHDPSGMVAERNVLRYRPLPGGVALRIGADAPERDVALVGAAAEAAGCRTLVSHATEETDHAFAHRLATLGVDRVRTLGTITDAVRAAVHELVLPLDDAPPVSDPEIELPRWLYEQSVTTTMHRHGHVHAEVAPTR
jgi:RHH-type transcriptional regulator, proline utilization regulon repressor / proline dehydrogenase / delta 1-pyrroline-5-carboxylate dehydrogenase